MCIVLFLSSVFFFYVIFCRLVGIQQSFTTVLTFIVVNNGLHVAMFIADN